jgi:hypothetical protein
MKQFITSLSSVRKTEISIAILLFIFCCMIHPVQSKAQDSMHLFSVTYIKLKDPAYAKQYEGLLNYYGRKVAEYGVKSGGIQGYYVLKVIMPSGSTSDYDYEVVVNSNSIITLLDDTTAILKNAIPGMTDDMVKSVAEQYGNIRTIVKKEVYSSLDAIPSTTAPQYIEVDYMKPAAGKFTDYLKAETGTWKPVHQERIKLGAYRVGR